MKRHSWSLDEVTVLGNVAIKYRDSYKLTTDQLATAILLDHDFIGIFNSKRCFMDKNIYFGRIIFYYKTKLYINNIF